MGSPYIVRRRQEVRCNLDVAVVICPSILMGEPHLPKITYYVTIRETTHFRTSLYSSSEVRLNDGQIVQLTFFILSHPGYNIVD